MSQDPGICGTCHEEKVRAKHQQPRIDWEEVTASTSGSLGGKAKLMKNFVYPYEYEDNSHCVDINCADGRANISDECSRINEDLGHAAQTGDWTGVDKEDLERLEQLSEHATDVVDVADIDWLDNDKAREWQEIQDGIDEFEQNTGKAIDRTAEVDSTPDATIHGKEKIPECRSTLDNLGGLRHSIYVQEVVVDNTNRITQRQVEQEVIVDEEPAIGENDENEQQERDETDQTPDEESTKALKERIKKLEQENEDLEAENEDLTGTLADRDETIEDLKAENKELIDDKSDLVDEKREVVDENHELSKDIMELQQKLQQLQATTRQHGPEHENDAAANAPSERAEAGTGAASPGATGGSEGKAGASGSSPRDPATEASPENNQAGASANGDTESLSKGQRWVRNPDAEKPDPIPEQYEQLFGEPLSEEARNGGTETTGPAHEDERDGRDGGTDQERDDDAPAGGPNF
jgi:hypothetical protein